MKKTLQRFLAMALVILTVASIAAVPASAASLVPGPVTITGNIGNSYGSPVHVYTNGAKATVRVCTFNQVGQRTSGKLYIKAVADSGAVWVFSITGCNGWSENTTNITLPAGNTHYRLYVCRRGTGNTNRTNTYYFSMDCKKNCWFF